ncbi:MAG: hypothetical protein ACFB03_04590 [Paracoccaceae bacterium]
MLERLSTPAAPFPFERHCFTLLKASFQRAFDAAEMAVECSFQNQA